MTLYHYDLHVHTSNVSPCAHVQAEEVVRLYAQAGYTGIVITDHYYDRFFQRLEPLPWRDKIARYLEGYHLAKKAGEKLGVDVFLGAEVKLNNSLNDYLVYGVNEEFLLEYPALYQLELEQLYRLLRTNGMLLYQAHPFRNYMDRVDPALLDGIEVFNGNPRHNSRNHLALVYAKAQGLKMVSGSDFHQIVDLASGGIILDDRPADNRDLVRALDDLDLPRLIGRWP